MKLIDRRDHVEEILKSKNLYFVSEDGGLYQYNIDGDIICIYKGCGYVFEEDSTLYMHDKDKFYCLNTDTHQFDLLMRVADANFFEPIDRKRIIVSQGEEEVNETLNLYDGDQLKWTIPDCLTYFNLLSKGVLFFRDNFDTREITRVDLETAEILWHYSLPEGFKVYVSVQLIDHILFFTATSRNLEHSKLIGLHIDTGEVLWEFENLIDFQVDHKYQLLRGYGGAFYQVIDPFSGKLLVNNYFKELWDKGIDPTSYDNTIVGDKLWFVSGRGRKAQFGTVDTTTSEVDFIQDFPIGDGSQFNKPVFHEGKLFLRDIDKVLYIFE